MEIKTSVEFRVVSGISEDLDYLIDRLQSEECKDQDYIDVNILEDAKYKADQDIKNYVREQETNCSALKEGAIILIEGGDGISYSQKDYYYITTLGNKNIACDLLTVIRGDYGNEIKLDKEHRIERSEFIKKYNKNYHTDNIDREEWEELVRYTEQIPWKD